MIMRLAGLLGMVSKVDNSKTIQKGLEWLDDRKFTDEEKSQYALDFARAHANENSYQSVVRRFLASSIIGVWLLFLLGTAIVWPFWEEYSDRLYELAGSMKFAVSAIIIFYFGYYGVTKIVDKFKGKKNKKEG